MSTKEFKPCSYRQKLVSFQRDGSKIPIYRCTSQESEHLGKDVTTVECEDCPVRTLLKQHQAPKFNSQHKIADTKKHEKAIGWETCSNRQEVQVYTCCGTMTLYRCDDKKCDKYDQEVTPEICRVCPFRK